MVQISVSRRHLVFLLIAAVVLVVAIPLAVSAATQRFVDVPPTDWAYDDVEWLAANGFTGGCTSDGTEYCPDEPVTRREMAAFMHRLSGDDATTITGRLDVLEAENAALRALLTGVSRDGDTLLFDGMNLQVVNGMNDTSTSNGLGNVIVGYNEDDPLVRETADRSGSHYLIVGDEHSWLSWGGIVAGLANEASGSFASVTGGVANTASGWVATVSGGSANEATNDFSSACGGEANTASEEGATVSGGRSNTASRPYSSVSGGRENVAAESYASVVGGWYNDATGYYSSVSGGYNNTASGYYSSVSGGAENAATNTNTSISGGLSNVASNTGSSVSGGSENTASGGVASVCGGFDNTAGHGSSAILGGSGEVTTALYGTYPYCGCAS